MLLKQIATLMGEACCTRLATFLRREATCWVLQIELVGKAWRNIAAQIWPNKYNIKHHRAWKIRIIFKLEPTTPNMSKHNRWPNASNMLPSTMLPVICCVEMLRSFCPDSWQNKVLSKFEVNETLPPLPIPILSSSWARVPFFAHAGWPSALICSTTSNLTPYFSVRPY